LAGFNTIFNTICHDSAVTYFLGHPVDDNVQLQRNITAFIFSHCSLMEMMFSWSWRLLLQGNTLVH